MAPGTRGARQSRHQGEASGGVAAVFSAGLHAESGADDQRLIFYYIPNYEINVAAPELTEPANRASSEATETSKASARKWHGALKRLVGIEGSDAIHICAETLAESTIDRCFCSIAPSQMIQLAVTSTTFSTPELLSRRRVSDHAAALVSFAMRDLKAEKNQPTAQYIFKSPIFEQIAEKVFALADLDKIARWLPAPFRAHAKAQDILDISSDQVRLTDPASFEEWASTLFRQDADQRRAAIDLARQRGRLPHAQARAQSQALHRQVQLWSLISKRLVLTGVKTTTGTATGPTERLQMIMEHWQPVFQGKNVDTASAESYLDRFVPKTDFNIYQPPDDDTLKRFASISSSTSPCMDGPPHIVWSAHEKCTETLWQVMTWMLGGGFFPDEANATAQAFLPKGEEPGDAEHIGCHRDPSKVRVLGPRNTSLKIISSTMNVVMAAVAADVVPASQRGFARRRNFGYSILELDVESRIASADPDAMTELPVLASLDIAQAFPSFAHQFIRLAPKAMGAPEAVLNFFDLMYHNILTLAPRAGSGVPLFYIRSGIIQGWGWSGTLYAMGAACFLLDLEQGVMALMEDLACLALKPAKCHIIPLAGPVDDELVDKLRSALIAIAPRFQGLFYANAFRKFRWRTKMYSASDAPSIGSAQLFNSRALLVLSYLAQCALLPHESFKVENWVNASVLRFPSGALWVRDWPRLRDWGVRAPRSTQLAMIAAIVRAATSTFHKFPEIRERLHQGIGQHGDDLTLLGAARAARHPSPPWWKMPPFVETFHQIVSAESDHRYRPPAPLAPALAAARATLAAGKPARVQRLAYAAARSAQDADEIGSFLAKRIMIKLPALVDVFENDLEVFDRVRAAMKKLPPSWAAAWMRALAHECGRRSCMFQCA
ncbi:unnamed protein product, partial [Prorocentrum cordatum]